jgi:hypothetical protein
MIIFKGKGSNGRRLSALRSVPMVPDVPVVERRRFITKSKKRKEFNRRGTEDAEKRTFTTKDTKFTTFKTISRAS